MKRETQAIHLARMMQDHIQHPSYELTLQKMMVSNKKLKKLSLNDVILTGFDRLELSMLKEDEICANLHLKKLENNYKTEIIYIPKETVEQYDSKKYKFLNISFGRVQSKRLEIGQTIDITHIDLTKVKLMLQDKIIAEGSLVIVDEEIAVQIEKVN